MKKLTSLFNNFIKRIEIMQNLPETPFTREPAVDNDKIETLIYGLETAFRENLPVCGKIPQWAETLKKDIIDWHEILAQEPDVLSIVFRQSYEKIYLLHKHDTFPENMERIIKNPEWTLHLGLIAKILTTLAENRFFLTRIRPEWFIFYQNHIWCNWEEIEAACITEKEKMIRHYEPGWMHPALRKREMSRNFPLIQAPAYTFAYLILFSLTRLPSSGKPGDFEIQIDRFRAYNPFLSPFFRLFFRKWLIPGYCENISGTPEDCWKEFSDLLFEISNRERIVYESGEIECGKDSVLGKNKRNNDNEDSIFILKGISSNHIIAGVADGVSTADIGSGWLAGMTVRKQFQDCEQKWTEILNSFPDPAKNLNHWKYKAQDILNEIFKSVHHAVVEEINRVSKGKKILPDHITMSSTLVLALMKGNKGIAAHWGDSRAYLVSTDGIFRLTEDHNNQLNDLVKSRKPHNPFKGCRQGFSSLTRVAGACYPDTDSGVFKPVAFEKQPVALNSFSLSDGEFLLLCSDGLLTSLSKKTEWEKENIIWSIFKDCGFLNCREIARQLVRTADDDLGNDNISVIVLRFSIPEK